MPTNLAQTRSPLAPLLTAAAAFLLLPSAWPARAPARQRTPPRRAATANARASNGQGLPAEKLLRIVRAEDERRWDAADLGALLSDESAAVRRRAALAAGRIGDEAAVAPLASLLNADQNEAVRASAAFALGETESASAADALLQALRLSKSAEVRARAVEALGKIAAALPEAQAARKRELGEAILSTLRIEQKAAKPSRGVVLMGLTAALRARPADAGKAVATFLSSTDARVRADAANTLARLRSRDANEQLRQLLSNDTDAVVRANVARALGAAEDTGAGDLLALRATTDVDPRVRVSAVRSLASLKDARHAPPLVARGDALLAAYKEAKAKGNPNPSEINELLEVFTTLGRLLAGTNDERTVTLLRGARSAVETGAAEIEVAFARVAPALYLREQPFANLARSGRLDAPVLSRWQRVSALAQGLGEFATFSSANIGNSAVSLQADAQMLLRAMLDAAGVPPLAQPDLMRAVAAFKPPDLADLVRLRLGASPDVIVRATAAELLGELTPDPQNASVLAAALPRALGEESNDAALAILDALGKHRTTEAFTAVESALTVSDPLVRRRAAALLTEMSGGARKPAATPAASAPATRNKPEDYRRALARAGRAVRAHVSTDKGQFTIELLPDSAPLTVDNFVQLANRKYFDNVTFHRVVPNFVVQGGDPRGDGNGGPGYQIRCEINTVPYARGAVGMALSGKDTGGSQWFVTHSPQPHLDGGYTVFGRVVEGMEVVDQLARGDRIRAVKITEGKQPPAAPQRPARGR
ncbi:MAG TPA: peptidylprolyl isomerase [Pyrinomonadaceae bacterium]|nr:peptidylprolyl isomerase [Pyrinomonadaceae bacterium]